MRRPWPTGGCCVKKKKEKLDTATECMHSLRNARNDYIIVSDFALIGAKAQLRNCAKRGSVKLGDFSGHHRK
jgi:hypothetical protein